MTDCGSLPERLASAKATRDKFDDGEPEAEALLLIQGSHVHCGLLSCVVANPKAKRIKDKARILMDDPSNISKESGCQTRQEIPH